MNHSAAEQRNENKGKLRQQVFIGEQVLQQTAEIEAIFTVFLHLEKPGSGIDQQRDTAVLAVCFIVVPALNLFLQL